MNSYKKIPSKFHYVGYKYFPYKLLHPRVRNQLNRKRSLQPWRKNGKTIWQYCCTIFFEPSISISKKSGQHVIPTCSNRLFNLILLIPSLKQFTQPHNQTPLRRKPCNWPLTISICLRLIHLKNHKDNGFFQQCRNRFLYMILRSLTSLSFRSHHFQHVEFWFSARSLAAYCHEAIFLAVRKDVHMHMASRTSGFGKIVSKLAIILSSIWNREKETNNIKLTANRSVSLPSNSPATWNTQALERDCFRPS